MRCWTATEEDTMEAVEDTVENSGDEEHQGLPTSSGEITCWDQERYCTSTEREGLGLKKDPTAFYKLPGEDERVGGYKPFQIQGGLYHLHGPLENEPGVAPRNAQVYVHPRPRIRALRARPRSRPGHRGGVGRHAGGRQPIHPHLPERARTDGGLSTHTWTGCMMSFMVLSLCKVLMERQLTAARI
jgi:hypothetical protein